MSTSSDAQAPDEATTPQSRSEDAEDDEQQKPRGQVTEAGGAFADNEAQQGGADAVPDKTTGAATGRG